ncbi:hypothetical protein [Nonomuraea sp. NPDC049709]|uniref:hypothetical protein n=1 Tax=Nonomuraea sp. NPDC049709 TaxID=3154736 RepID=UPI003424C9E5
MFDELSISLNSIDRTTAVNDGEGLKPTPAWSSADDRLEPFVGQDMREGTLLEWRRPA